MDRGSPLYRESDSLWRDLRESVMNPEIVATDVVYWIRGQEFADLARVSIESVRKVYGNRAQVFVYTDDPALRTVEGATVLCRLAPGEPAMVANLTAQVRHLTMSQHGQRVLFLDADTIVRKPFPFDDDHDLIVTWRDHERVTNGEKIAGVAAMMPYNYGVIGARVSPASIEAFMAMRASVLRMSVQYRNWYGNQNTYQDADTNTNTNTNTNLDSWWTYGDSDSDFSAHCN